jgi:protocatechuate 3,4-dioxygenase beta subunit
MRRRHLLAAPPLLALGARSGAVLAPTPRQSAGPFYPAERPLDDDADLVRVAGAAREARGTITHLHGQVLDLDGLPVADALVEIWQCDAGGRYHHPLDRGPAPDPGFQGYGRTRSATDGRYRFRTIRPVPYPGRTPHVHFAVTPPGGETLVTQMYVRGEPLNARDGIFTRIPPRLRDRVLVALAPRPGATGELEGRFDIVTPVVKSRD